ncbi:ABC transporter permease [Fusibacter sp. JL216-2]|uniref:ABC transporter permease n=1 Tax=Fusibacter sp. JL216-2 TaxID=3071453 RepID=UPI003D32D21F
MKLWYSFVKELSLSSKSWYFYIEIGMALVLLLILLFVIPEDFDTKGKQYLYLELPQVVEQRYHKNLREDDLNNQAEKVEIKSGGQIFTAVLYETEAAKIYILDSYEALKLYSERESQPGVYVHVNDKNQIVHTYYLQGYETQKYRNLLMVYHNRLTGYDAIEAYSDSIEVRQLKKEAQVLTDKENMIPVFLTFNGSLMSLFIVAAYIFLDKSEGIIKAYAITASSVWHYLLSKIGVIIFTSIITTLIITVPTMGGRVRYLGLIVFVLSSGFFAGALGLLLTSYYKDIVEAFGAMYIVILLMIMPNISYFTPSWDPDWVKIIPSYVMLQSFKEIISVHGNMTYVFVASLGFLVIGLDLFILANYRFKKTLSL